MAHGEFIMKKVNEDLVEHTTIDLTTTKARVNLKRYIATHHRPSRAVCGGNSRSCHNILDMDFELTPLEILNLRFFSKAAWGMPSMSKERESGEVLTSPAGLNLPLITGATFEDYTALLLKACGWDYHPFIGVKDRDEAYAAAIKAGMAEKNEKEELLWLN